jgi:histidine triad (HIT) family protein
MMERRTDMENDANCIFCKIVSGKIPSNKIYEDEKTFAFADIAPLSSGHCLVIPKVHRENIFEMQEEELYAVVIAVKKIAHALKATLNQPGLTILQLNGRAANQVVMHYHVHLIPRDRDRDGLDKLEWEARPGDLKQIAEIAGKVKAGISV